MSKIMRVVLIVTLSLALLSGTATAYVSANKTYTINLNGEKIEGKSGAKTVEELLKENDIEYKYGDLVKPDLDNEIRDGMIVVVEHKKAVTIYTDGVPKHIFTSAKTVGELVKNLDSDIEYALKGNEETDEVTDGMTVNLTTEIVKVTKEIEKIDFETQEIENAELEFGIKNIVQEGIEGEKELTYEEKTVAGKKGDKVLVSEEIINEAVAEIYEVGIAKSVNTENGPKKYLSKMSMTATAYTQYDAGCNNITATGAILRHGIVAVDPRVIPLGTKLYVEGYGEAIAADTGGAIKGNKIDLAYDSVASALQFGRREVMVYILED